MSTTRDGASAAEMADNSRLSHLTNQDATGLVVRDYPDQGDQKFSHGDSANERTLVDNIDLNAE